MKWCDLQSGDVLFPRDLDGPTNLFLVLDVNLDKDTWCWLNLNEQVQGSSKIHTRTTDAFDFYVVLRDGKAIT